MDGDRADLIQSQDQNGLRLSFSDSISMSSRDFPYDFEHLPRLDAGESISGLGINDNSARSFRDSRRMSFQLDLGENQGDDDANSIGKRSRLRSFDSILLAQEANRGDRIEDFPDFMFMSSYSPSFGGQKYNNHDTEEPNEQNNWNISSAFLAAREKFTQIANKIQSGYTAGRKVIQNSADFVRQNYDHQIVPSLLPYDLYMMDKSLSPVDPMNLELSGSGGGYEGILEMHSELTAKMNKATGESIHRGIKRHKPVNEARLPSAPVPQSGVVKTTHLISPSIPTVKGSARLRAKRNGNFEPIPSVEVPNQTQKNTSLLNDVHSGSNFPQPSRVSDSIRTMKSKFFPSISTSIQDDPSPVPYYNSLDGITSGGESESDKSFSVRRSTRASRSRIRYRDEDFDIPEEESLDSRPSRKGRKTQVGTSVNTPIEKKKGLSNLEALLLQRGDPLKRNEKCNEKWEGEGGGDQETPLVTTVFPQDSIEMEYSSLNVERARDIAVPMTDSFFVAEETVNTSTVEQHPAYHVNSLYPSISNLDRESTNPTNIPIRNERTIPNATDATAQSMDFFLSSGVPHAMLGESSAHLFSRQMEETQRQILLHRMIQMLQSNEFDQDELLVHVLGYKDLHASFGQKCWQDLQRHLSAIRELLCPDSITRMSLWTISHADGKQGERLPTQLLNTFRAVSEKVGSPTVSTGINKNEAESGTDGDPDKQEELGASEDYVPGVGVGVWAQAASHCKLTEAQQQQILKLSEAVHNRRNHMISLFQKIDLLEKEINDNFSETDLIMRNLTNLLTPEQVVKFYEFTERSTTLFDLVSSLRTWPLPPDNDNTICPKKVPPFPRDSIPFQTAYANVMTKLSYLLNEEKQKQSALVRMELTPDGEKITNPSSATSLHTIHGASEPSFEETNHHPLSLQLNGSNNSSNVSRTAPHQFENNDWQSLLHSKHFAAETRKSQSNFSSIPASWMSNIVGNLGNQTQSLSNSGFFSAISDFQAPKFALQTGLPDILDLSSAGRVLDAATEAAGMYVAKASAAAEVAANHARHLSSAAADKAVTRAKQLSDTAASAAAIFYSTVLGYTPGGGSPPAPKD